MNPQEPMSEAEKIDRIYRMLRDERRARLIGIAIKLCILFGLAYTAYYLSLPANADVRNRMTESAQKKMGELMLPLVNTMVQDMTMGSGATSATGSRRRPSINITPEMIRAAQEAQAQQDAMQR